MLCLSLWAMPARAGALSPLDDMFMLAPQGADPRLRAIVEQFEAGQAEAAQDELDALLRMEPDNPDALLVRGYVRLAQRDLQGALDDAASIFARRTPSKDALDLMGTVFARYRQAARSDETDARIRTVEITSYEKLLALFPDWPELLFRTASQRIALERLEPSQFDQLGQAVSELTHLIAVLPDDADPRTQGQARFQLGRAWKHIEDARPTPGRKTGPLPDAYAKAISHFEDSLNIDPTRLDAVGEIVLVYLAAGRADQALERVRNAQADYPQPAERAKLLEMEGRLLFDAGRQGEATEKFRNAVEIDPTRDASHLTLAHILAATEDRAAARLHLEKAARQRPLTLEIHAARALLAAPEDPRHAIAALETLLDVPPAKAVALGMRPSPERYKIALYAKAATDLARLRLEQGDRIAARAALEKAQRLGGDPAALAALRTRLEDAESQP